MTSALEQEAAEQGAVPYPPYSSIEFCPEPYQKVIVYLSGNQEFDDQQIEYALLRFKHGYDFTGGASAPQRPVAAPPPQQQYQQPAAPQAAAQTAPQCPVHVGRAMKFFEANGNFPATWKCTGKTNGQWCDQRVGV